MRPSRRLLALGLLSAACLIYAPTASAETPNDAALTSVARDYLTIRAESMVRPAVESGPAETPKLQQLPLSARMKEVLAADLQVLHEKRNSLANMNEEYTDSATTVTTKNLEVVSAGRVILTVDETTSFTYARIYGDEPPTTAYYLGNVYQQVPSDMMQMDFDRNGNMNHSMITTYKSSYSGMVYFTYHTSDHLNRSMSSIYNDYRRAWYYAYRT